jgi:hypothetical protein
LYLIYAFLKELAIRQEMQTGFWWGNLKERELMGVDGRVILKWIFMKYE